MTASTHQTSALTVKQMQERVQEATRVKQVKRNRLSRMARLNLIDILSRWSSIGLAIICGGAVFLGTLLGRLEPMRTTIWLLMVFAGLYACSRLRQDFRAGEKTAAHPFRWRANYTSALTVLSAAFGAGALIVVRPGAGLELLSFMAMVSVCAAATHIAHGRSAAALLAPTGLFIIAATLREAGVQYAVFGAAAFFVCASAGLFLASRNLQARAAAQYPRTRLARRRLIDEISTPSKQADFRHETPNARAV